MKVEGGTFAFGTIPAALGTATVSFSGGSTICSNTASSTETPAFNLGTSGASSTVTFGNLGLGYTGSLNFNGAATLLGSTTLQVNVPTTISGSITDNGNGYGLTTQGPAIISLNNNNTYGGGTFVLGGTLQMGSGFGSALGSSSGAVTVNGGLLDINGNAATTGPVTLASGSIIDSFGGGSINATGYTLQSGTATRCSAAPAH